MARPENTKCRSVRFGKIVAVAKSKHTNTNAKKRNTKADNTNANNRNPNENNTIANLFYR